MRKLYVLLGMALAVALAAFGLGFAPTANASVDTPANVESVQRPMHNETSLSLFSCAATRPSGFTSATVLHSHRIAAASTVDIFGQPAIDAFDCEVQNAGSPGDEATFRTYYIYDNVDGGGDKGIIGPLNVNRF